MLPKRSYLLRRKRDLESSAIFVRRETLKVGENEFEIDELTADEAENLAEDRFFWRIKKTFSGKNKENREFYEDTKFGN